MTPEVKLLGGFYDGTDLANPGLIVLAADKGTVPDLAVTLGTYFYALLHIGRIIGNGLLGCQQQYTRSINPSFGKIHQPCGALYAVVLIQFDRVTLVLA